MLEFSNTQALLHELLDMKLNENGTPDQASIALLEKILNLGYLGQNPLFTVDVEQNKVAPIDNNTRLKLHVALWFLKESHQPAVLIPGGILQQFFTSMYFQQTYQKLPPSYLPVNLLFNSFKPEGHWLAEIRNKVSACLAVDLTHLRIKMYVENETTYFETPVDDPVAAVYLGKKDNGK